MNSDLLSGALTDLQRGGLYSAPFEVLDVSVYKHIQYANNVLIVAGGHDVDCHLLAAYSLLCEASNFFYWSDSTKNYYLKNVDVKEFKVVSFVALQKTHFRGNKIFDKVDATAILSVYQLFSPAYDDDEGCFLVKSNDRNYILMWDYCD